MRKPKGPLTADRIAALTAEGRLDPTNHYWHIGLPPVEWTRVYTLRAAAERRYWRQTVQQGKNNAAAK